MDKELDMTSVAEELLQLGAATIGESGGTPLDPRLHPVRLGMRACGPAYPVACAPGDNLAIHIGVAEAPPGCVLAVSVGDMPARGYWGEVLTAAAVSRGIAGLVIDGCVRDTDTFEGHHFPVFAQGTALRGTSKDRGGSIGGAVIIGGYPVAEGDWLVADSDGVAVVAARDFKAVHEAARRRGDKEAGYFRALAQGATTLELLSLDRSRVTRAGGS